MPRGTKFKHQDKANFRCSEKNFGMNPAFKIIIFVELRKIMVAFWTLFDDGRPFWYRSRSADGRNRLHIDDPR
jgi:hypothetical protein